MNILWSGIRLTKAGIIHPLVYRVGSHMRENRMSDEFILKSICSVQNENSIVCALLLLYDIFRLKFL